MSPLLVLEDVGCTFGGIRAVDGLDLVVAAGGVQGLIGPNGSGKSTVFNLVTGHHAPQAGRIRLDGTDLLGLRPSAIVRRGIARTFQNLRLFRELTVLDNVRVALPSRPFQGLASTLLRLPGFRAEEARQREEARALLDWVGLESRAELPAGALPYGEARLLEVARALATGPRLLLLDEPAAGMNGREVEGLKALVRRIRDERGVTVLLIEHHVAFVRSLCDRVTVMEHGGAIADGPPDLVMADPRVVEAYMGRRRGAC